MSNPINEVYFIAKALTEVVGEKVEDNITNVLSDLGKFDAETRQRLNEFTQEVKARAEASKQQSEQTNTNITIDVDAVVDPQELLDELRHEIARLKSELTNYRQNN
jgi:hypothetical protein